MVLGSEEGVCAQLCRGPWAAGAQKKTIQDIFPMGRGGAPWVKCPCALTKLWPESVILCPRTNISKT